METPELQTSKQLEGGEIIKPNGERAQIMSAEEIAAHRTEADSVQAERDNKAVAIGEKITGGGREKNESKEKVTKGSFFVAENGKYVFDGSNAKQVEVFVVDGYAYATKEDAQDGKNGERLEKFNLGTEYSKDEMVLTPRKVRFLEDSRANRDPDFAEKIRKERSFGSRIRKWFDKIG
jgi:hypothetical protein